MSFHRLLYVRGSWTLESKDKSLALKYIQPDYWERVFLLVMRNPLRLLLILVLVSGGLPLLSADVAKTVERYRASFEKRMNAELDQHGRAARDLRLSYLAALEKLKRDMARAENLKGAAQVLEEIDLVAEGEELKALPANVDYRFKRAREKWERGLQEIRAARNKKLQSTVDLYFEALDAEKRRLTRKGAIKDALAIEAEGKRVVELPEVKALSKGPAPSGEPSEKLQNFALATRGATALGAKRPEALIDGKEVYNKYNGFAYEKIPCDFTVALKTTQVLSRIRLLLPDLQRRKYGYRILTSKDGESWEVVHSAKNVRAGWQEVELEKLEARFIRINGLSNTANDEFHVVEIQALGR